VERVVKHTALLDGPDTAIFFEQEPGAAGKAFASHLIRELGGYAVYAVPASGKKPTRAKPVSAQAEAGHVSLVNAPWNAAFLSEAEYFPDGSHDDQIDAVSGAFAALGPGLPRKGGIVLADVPPEFEGWVEGVI
jgi:predicted phage terminase large subunit-like protein